MSSKTPKSAFAVALQSLLDDTNLFTRPGWAEFLGVKEPVIDQWLNDESIPAGYDLRMILTTLDQSSGVVAAPIAAFKEMASRRATEVSPHGAQMLPTVHAYIGRPLFNELSSRLAKLDPEGRGKLLEVLFPADAAPGTQLEADVQGQGSAPKSVGGAG